MVSISRRQRTTRYSKYFYANTAKIMDHAKCYSASWLPDQAMVKEELRLTIATHFADLFQQDNPRFDRTRFLKACKGDNSEQS